MQPLVTESIGEAPSEIEETKPTQLLATDDVGEVETSTGRQQVLSSKSEGTKKEAWQFNQSKEDLGKLIKDKFNQFEDIKELEKFLLLVKVDLQTTRKKAKSKKKRGKKAQEGESGGESKLWSKGRAILSDTEEVLHKISDIGVKPATTSGNKVASESYNLLHEVLKGIGNLHWAAVGFSMVAFFLDRVKEVGDNSGKSLDLLETMCSLGLDMVKAFPHLPQNADLLWRMSTEITNGVSLCCRYQKSGRVSRFAFSTVSKDDFESLSNKLKELSTQFLRAIEVAHLEKQSETYEAVQEILTELKEIRSNPVSSAHEPTEEHKQQRFGNFQHLPHDMVRNDFVMESIKAKLRDFRTLGLFGMGGVGKSTLAKAIFNELCPDFEYSCFVADVKLKQGNSNDIKEEVLKLMHYKGKKVGDKPVLSALDGKKLLLVFDDISISTRDGEEEVLSIMRDVTAFESRFIVTSKEGDLVKSLGEAYRVPFLNEDAAFKLFKSHAFPGQESPPPTLPSLMETIVTKCDGLPLTLTVLGKYLKDKRDEKYWKETLQALMKAEDVSNFTNRLWAKLRPSYDGLRKQEQQIFLDAATFFNAKYLSQHYLTLGVAKAAWRAAYGTSVTLWWQTLVDLSLVYEVEDDDHIRMHEQLQSLGVKIAKEASNDGNCRVWDAELGLQILLQSTNKMNGKTFHAFRARRLDLESDRNGEDIHIPSSALLNLKQLHFFEAENRIIIDGAKQQGSVPSELVLLRCVGQNLFNPALQNRLAILHISGLEYLPDAIGQLSNLDQLTIYQSPYLSCLPESLGRLSSLRRLRIYTCSSLQTLPESIGGLSSLSYLEIWSCDNLCTLPDSFGGLSSLGHLEFQHCDNLRSLPDSFGGLSSLSHLEFQHCDNLCSLPDSFGGLSSLSHLEFRSCPHLCTLPESFGGLSLLSHLEFIRCEKLCTLPDSFGGLSSLSHLDFQMCENLRTLPDSFGGLSSLSHLLFRFCDNLCTLPDSFAGLSSLSYLGFWSCDNLCTLPDSFGGLSSLSHLEFRSCENLRTLPNSFTSLSSLSHLEFITCPHLCTLPDSFGGLSSLSYLEIWSCDNLCTLPDSFGGLSSLRHLEFRSCENLRTLPDSLWGLSSLSHLEFESCPHLCSLPDSFGGLSSLSHLEFRSCKNLRTLPDSFGGLSSLSHLKLERCEKLCTLPDSFGGLSSLSHLKLQMCEKLRSLPGSFGGLSCLKHLILDVESLPNSFGDLKNLRYLEIWRKSAASIQDSIKSLPSLETLKLFFIGVGDTACSPLPSWLKEPNAPASIGKYSRIEFQVQDGYFSVKDSRSFSSSLMLGRYLVWERCSRR